MKARVEIFLLCIQKFRMNTTRHTKKVLCNLKETIQQQDRTTVNVYASNVGAAKYIKKLITNINEHMDNNTTTIEDWNTSLTSMDRLSKQLAFNDSLGHMDLTYKVRAFISKTFISKTEYTLFCT